MSERPYPDGVDCVWFASDHDGHLGVFVTGGVGPIPLHWLNDDGVQIEDAEALICELPIVSAARMLISIKRPDDFLELASRGFFVYDWRDVHRSSGELHNAYEAVAIPITPITIDRLSDGLAGMAKSLIFVGVAFADAQPLDVCKYAGCRDSDGLSRSR